MQDGHRDEARTPLRKRMTKLSYGLAYCATGRVLCEQSAALVGDQE